MSNKNCQDCVTICCDGICPPMSSSNANIQKSRQDKPPPPRKQERFPLRQCLLERPQEPIDTKYGPTSSVKPICQAGLNQITSDLQQMNMNTMPFGKEPPELPPPQEPIAAPRDMLTEASETKDKMGPIGPWATGRVDWSPLAGLTGTRPVVDRYSITRYSTNEWFTRNDNILEKGLNSFARGLKTENDSKNTMTRTFAVADQTQADSTNRLKSRSHDLHKWKSTLERAISAQADEISTLEEQRVRLKKSLAVLQKPEAIASECLERRCYRADTELIRDAPEEELIKEVALISEIRDVFTRTLKDIDAQQIENRTARERLEYDWSDKKDALEIDTINCGLNNKSTTVLFKPGATRYLDEQSSEEYWEHFTKETLEQCELTRQKSITLRSTLDAILINAARDLRTQADTVERALTDRVAEMDEIRTKLENDLLECLNRLAETEKLIDRLTNGMENLDNSMKVAQTRLDNRNQRPHVENCRDAVQYGLIDEVKAVQDGVTAMLATIQLAEDTKNDLMRMRGELEREIMLKRKSIMVDRDRCLLLRSHFPSASALSGY